MSPSPRRLIQRTLHHAGRVRCHEFCEILDLLNQKILRVVVDTGDYNRALSRGTAREVLQFYSGGHADGVFLRC